MIKELQVEVKTAIEKNEFICRIKINKDQDPYTVFTGLISAAREIAYEQRLDKEIMVQIMTAVFDPKLHTSVDLKDKN